RALTELRHVEEEGGVAVRRLLDVVEAGVVEVEAHRPAAWPVHPDRADGVDALGGLAGDGAGVGRGVGVAQVHLRLGLGAGGRLSILRVTVSVKVKSMFCRTSVVVHFTWYLQSSSSASAL